MTLTVTAVPDWTDRPRVRVDVDSSAAGLLPVRAGSTVKVYRVHEDGVRYRVITEVGARLSSTSWAGFDYHAPFNRDVTYLAIADGQTSGESGPVYLENPSGVWLIHPSDPLLSVQVDAVDKVGALTRPSKAVEQDVYDSLPVFHKGGRGRGINGSLVIRCDTPEATQPILDLLEDDGQILINTPGGTGWDVGWMWVQPGDEVYDNFIGVWRSPYRHATFSYKQTAQPDIDLESPWTIADVVAEYATTTALLLHYDTCEELTLDLRH